MKTEIFTEKAPGAIGPYSQAVRSGDLVFVSFISPPYPARACVQVAALPRNGIVEIEAVARCSAGTGAQ